MSQDKELLELSNRMFSNKQTWDQMQQEIAYFFAPHLAEFTEEIHIGDEFARHISDPVPTTMGRDLGDAFGTMLRSDEWFKVTVDNEEVRELQHVAEFLDMMTETTRAMLYDRRAGFTRMAKEHEHSFALFGAGASSINLNKNYDGFAFRNFHHKDIAYSVNDENSVDRLSRRSKPEVRQLMEQFDGRPHTNLPQAVKTMAKNKPEDKYEIFHVCVPRDMYTEQTRKFPPNARYVSVYLGSEGEIIQENPEYEFPYIVSRWREVSGWGPYPFSPATMTALPHARMMQRAMLSLIEAGEKGVSPPLIATTEAISSPVDISAGGITWVDSEYDERMGAPLVPLELGKNAVLGDRVLDQFHNLMAETMYISKLNIPNTSSETAFEVAQLVQQNIRQLQPVFEPAQDEIIYKYLDRVVATGIRLGAYGPLENFPEELRGSDVTYTFMNPLQQERERRKLAQFGEAAQVAQAAAALDPSLLMEFNPIRWVRDAMQGVGVPQDWLVSEEQAMMARYQQQKQAQQQLEVAQARETAGAVTDGAVAAQEVQKAVQGPEVGVA